MAHLASRAAGDESAKGKYCIDLGKKKVREFCLEFRTQPREAQRETRERETRDCCLSTQHKLVDLFLSTFFFLSLVFFPPHREADTNLRDRLHRSNSHRSFRIVLNTEVQSIPSELPPACHQGDRVELSDWEQTMCPTTQPKQKSTCPWGTCPLPLKGECLRLPHPCALWLEVCAAFLLFEDLQPDLGEEA